MIITLFSLSCLSSESLSEFAHKVSFLADLVDREKRVRGAALFHSCCPCFSRSPDICSFRRPGGLFGPSSSLLMLSSGPLHENAIREKELSCALNHESFLLNEMIYFLLFVFPPQIPALHPLLLPLPPLSILLQLIFVALRLLQPCSLSLLPQPLPLPLLLQQLHRAIFARALIMFSQVLFRPFVAQQHRAALFTKPMQLLSRRSNEQEELTNDLQSLTTELKDSVLNIRQTLARAKSSHSAACLSCLSTSCRFHCLDFIIIFHFFLFFVFYSSLGLDFPQVLDTTAQSTAECLSRPLPGEGFERTC